MELGRFFRERLSKKLRNFANQKLAGFLARDFRKPNVYLSQLQRISVFQFSPAFSSVCQRLPIFLLQ